MIFSASAHHFLTFVVFLVGVVKTLFTALTLFSFFPFSFLEAYSKHMPVPRRGKRRRGSTSGANYVPLDRQLCLVGGLRTP
jgi:hypothetical protein